ncbi:MAG: DNA topoisomerase IV subunit A [Spirochaetia bacterium]|jgi:topoisomerase-4 subunit A|nr:DNA topoisomerase IV subunit A [Spirochaetia bacterium]
MAYVKKLFNENFLYYASYVIKDRAIPELEDGLKPVQRRIMHTLFEADDGKYHKVANIVGSCMKYHPHGDASIYSAVVVLANKDLFIDKQGNFGNVLTGDEASAARYIECRASTFSKDVFYNPKITEYNDSYDGRNKEPVIFPAKIPVVVITGAEGIAVGMSTKILPHNPVEVLTAEIACLRGQTFSLFPDFPTSGILDASEYQDGMGRVRVRSTLDTSDPKRIIIRDLPYGVTTESLIESVEAAAKSGRLKIASISDFTTDRVEIEVKLARGVYSQETVDALYAFTQCEQSISCNLLVIKNGQPTLMTVTDVVRHHAKRLLAILKAELDLEIRELLDELHARTLERIFIEERVYKAIESKKTQAAVEKAVIDGLKPFAAEIKREVSAEDVERLLRIPIRRISLYDIEKARAEMERIKTRLKEARHHLAHLTDYGIDFLEGLVKKLKSDWARKTSITSFSRVDAKEVAKRDISVRYDPQTGYLGTSVSGGEYQFDVSPFDKILVIRHSGIYSVVPTPEKLFVDKGMLYCGVADKDMLSDIIFSLVYLDPRNGSAYIKRCRIEGWIMNKDYQMAPEGAQVLFFTAMPKKTFIVSCAPKPRFKIDEERFKVESYPVKGLKAMGVRLSTRKALSAAEEGSPGLFDSPVPSGPSTLREKKTSAAGKKTSASDKKKASPKKPASSSKKTASTTKKPSVAAKKTSAKPKLKPKTTKPEPTKANDSKPHGGLLDKATAKKKPPKT